MDFTPKMFGDEKFAELMGRADREVTKKADDDTKPKDARELLRERGLYRDRGRTR